MDFDTLFVARRWNPIRNCPGRFVLAAGALPNGPEELAGAAQPQEFTVANARDAGRRDAAARRRPDFIPAPRWYFSCTRSTRRKGSRANSRTSASSCRVDVVSTAEFGYKELQRRHDDCSDCAHRRAVCGIFSLRAASGACRRDRASPTAPDGSATIATRSDARPRPDDEGRRRSPAV